MRGGTTTAANSQASESEKRRKQSVERAKANHLSRQLQMRLQYARLKVDHGWQKQNLNEVENLYFRHSHQRGPKPYSSTPVLIATTYQDPPSYPMPGTTQSSLSFKLGPSSLSRSHTSDHIRQDNGDQGTDNGLHTNNTSSSSKSTSGGPSSESHSASPSPNENTVEGGPLSTVNVQHKQKRSPTPSTARPHLAPSSTTFNPHPDVQIAASNPTGNSYPSGVSNSLIPPWGTTSVPSSNPPASKYYPNLTQRQNQQHTPPPIDGYGLGSSALTYDSFWSTHSTSSVTRPFRSSTGNALADTPSGSTSSIGESAGSSEVPGQAINGSRQNGGGISAAGRER